MADDNQDNDEYKFVELDALDGDSMGGMESDVATSSSQNSGEKKDIKRNALVAFGFIVFIMIMYKLIGYLFFSGKSDVAMKKSSPPIAVVATPPPVQQQEVVPPIPVQPVQVSIPVDNTDLNKKVSAVEISQENVREEINSVSQQVGSVNNTINNLSNQVTNLNQVIGTLSTQMQKQSEELNKLMLLSQPKRVKKPITHRAPSIAYYIQAVIPGRAWLINTNGSTLTVREGTAIKGYGVVKLIDPMQGRVITSSGQIIRFSQEDS